MATGGIACTGAATAGVLNAATAPPEAGVAAMGTAAFVGTAAAGTAAVGTAAVAGAAATGTATAGTAVAGLGTAAGCAVGWLTGCPATADFVDRGLCATSGAAYDKHAIGKPPLCKLTKKWKCPVQSCAIHGGVGSC